MKKITKKLRKRIDSPAGFTIKNWDSGALFGLSMDWDCDEHIISSKEVLKSLKEHMKKWKDAEKFKVHYKRLYIDYIR